MALRDTLEAVLREYDSAKLTTFAGNPLAVFIRKEALGLRLHLDLRQHPRTDQDLSWLRFIA